MNDQELLDDINLWEAHLSEASKVAARIRQRLQPVSTGRSKKKVNPKILAKILGHKRKIQLRKKSA